MCRRELDFWAYDSKNPTRRWLHHTRYGWISDALRRYALDSNSKALEVGPGSGIYLPLLAELFEKVKAVDVEPGYLRQAESIAKKFPNVAVIADDITNSKLPEGSFDLILL